VVLLLTSLLLFPNLVGRYRYEDMRGRPRRFEATENAAGYAGDYFVRCSVEPKRNVNRCYVYGRDSGKVICARDFRLATGERYARKDELKFAGFDGENIFLNAGFGEKLQLKPLMACKVED